MFYFFMFLLLDISFRVMILGENVILELRFYGFIFSVVFCIDLIIFVGFESCFYFEKFIIFL